MDELNKMEKYYIKEYNTFNDGYNLTIGGDGTLGKKHSENTKEKIRQKAIGRKWNDDQKKIRSKQYLGKNNPNYGNGNKISGENNPNYGKKMSNETKKRIGVANRGRKWTDDQKMKLIEYHSTHENVAKRPEVRKKISDSLKGHIVSIETRQKISNALKGKSTSFKGKKRKILTCPHCNTHGGDSNMKRWHFDNCKRRI